METTPEQQALKKIIEAKEKGLTDLDFEDNQLTMLPAEIGQLTNLAILMIYDNQITILPNEIGQLTNLTYLILEKNELSYLPAEIGRLINLTKVFLGNNQLTKLPVEIGQLTNLKELSLFNNQLTKLPVEIGQLTNLKELDLSGNQLTMIPAEIGQLINLKELNLSGNQLTMIPAEIGQLINLKELDLSDNQLTTIPTEIGQLINLKKLVLSGNKLTYLPAEIGQLTNLEELCLYNGQLKTIPAEIGQLINLTHIFSFNNQLTIIPIEIGRLKNLKYLDLTANPLKNISPEFLEANKSHPQKIFDQLKRLEKEDLVAIKPEIKLLLVGEAKAGKTQTRNRLINNLYNRTEDRTPGLEIERKQLLLEDYNVNVWDFGGQNKYLVAHKCFFTQKSIYIHVCDKTKSAQENNFNWWFNNIKHIGGCSPTIITINKDDLPQKKCYLNEYDLITNEKHILEILNTSCAEPRNIDALKEIILKAIEHIPKETEWIEKWYKIKLKLEEISEKDNKKYIYLSNFKEICEDLGVKEQIDKEILSETLHLAGNIIHFYDSNDVSLHNPVIINPNWATEAIYILLHYNETHQKLGKLTYGEIRQVWCEKNYDDTEVNFFITLMEEYGLMFKLDRNNYILPEYLEDTQPLDIDVYPYQVKQEYIYRGFFPDSIVSRLIVRLNKDLSSLSKNGGKIFWRHGAIFEQNAAKALVYSIPQTSTIMIKINNDSPDAAYFKTITSAIEDIQDKIYSNLEMKRYIGFRCKPNCRRGEECNFDIDKLKEMRHFDNNKSTGCKDGKALYIDSLVNGIIQEIEGGTYMDKRDQSQHFTNCEGQFAHTVERDMLQTIYENSSKEINLPDELKKEITELIKEVGIQKHHKPQELATLDEVLKDLYAVMNTPIKTSELLIIAKKLKPIIEFLPMVKELAWVNQLSETINTKISGLIEQKDNDEKD